MIGCSGVVGQGTAGTSDSNTQNKAQQNEFDKMIAEIEAQKKAQQEEFDKVMAKRVAETEAKDTERDKSEAEAQSNDKKAESEREDLLKEIKDSEAKAAAEREARLTTLEAEADEAQAEQAQADKERADREKAEQEEEEKEKAEQEARLSALEAQADKAQADKEKDDEEKADKDKDYKDKDNTDGKSSDEADGPSDADYNAALLFIRDILDVRFPTGKVILNEEEGAAVIKQWGMDITSAESIVPDILLSIHEGGHMYNQSLKRTELPDGRGCDTYYYLTLLTKPFTTSWGELKAGDKLDFAPCGLTYPNSTESDDDVSGISRSTILLDTQNYKRPPKNCSNCPLSQEDGEGDWGYDDTYAGLYLPGAPEEGKITHYKEGFPGFDPSFTLPTNVSSKGGDQAYGMLFEETLQYVNSLAVRYSYHDYTDTGSGAGSQKTAVLLWFWWNERYLKLTREYYPEEYEQFIEHYAEPFLYVWGKGWRYLETPSLNSNTKWDHLLELVTDDLMLGEIQHVRERYHGDVYQRGSELSAIMNTDPDGTTWGGPALSGPPLIVDSKSADGRYFEAMPGGFTVVNENREGFTDISEYIDKYNARSSVNFGGYGNTAD